MRLNTEPSLIGLLRS